MQISYVTDWPLARTTYSYHMEFSPVESYSVAQLYISTFNAISTPPGDTEEKALWLGFTHVEWLDEIGAATHDAWPDAGVVTLVRKRLTRLDWQVQTSAATGRWIMNVFTS